MRLDLYAKEHNIDLGPIWITPDVIEEWWMPIKPKQEEIVGYVPDFAHALPGSRYNPTREISQ